MLGFKFGVRVGVRVSWGGWGLGWVALTGDSDDFRPDHFQSHNIPVIMSLNSVNALVHTLRTLHIFQIVSISPPKLAFPHEELSIL